jgi:acetoacetyl-CoA synthetase
MSYQAEEGEILWRPSKEVIERANLTQYMGWLKDEQGLDFDSYGALWQWSVDEVESFWESLWRYFGIIHSAPYEKVLSSRAMPGARWFEGARLNYAEQVFRRMNSDHPALLFQTETTGLTEMSWQELHDQVAAVATALKRMGVGKGDRVVAYMPNTPETLVAFLACASLGAVWSSCSPDFAGRSVIDRFKQISPKVLIATNGYMYGGKSFSTVDSVLTLKTELDSLEQVVLVSSRDLPQPTEQVQGTVPWEQLLKEAEPLVFEQVPFDHPIWVVYSSGTTGKPKGLVHSQGGVLLEFMKFHSFHLDLHPGDRFFWFSTTGWVMWNIVAGSLLVGAVPVLFDGNPAYPDMSTLWRLAEKSRFGMFGTSAAFITACMQQDMKPGADYDLSNLRAIGSTGSPLSAAGFKWVYQEVASNIVLGSTSGGTDITSGFLGACALLPVRAAELQCRCLGVNAQAWDEEGNALIGEVGELVITQPMPSMPVYLWDDPDNQRYLESYFDVYPGVWRHGDWLKLTPEGGCVIMGRSDSTLNRQGVRMGSSDFYNVLDEMPELADSLIVGYTDSGGQYRMPLFVVPADGVALDGGLKKKIATTLRTTLSPRHVPDDVFAVDDIPRTLNGKKMEVPVIKVLSGVAVGKAVNLGSMSNPESMDYFIGFAAKPPW